MMRKFFLALTVILISAPASGRICGRDRGQGYGQGSGGGRFQRTPTGPPEISLVTIEGEIQSSFLDQEGIQYPVIVVDDKAIRLGPLWYLQQEGITLEEDDYVVIAAALCHRFDADIYYAFSITLILDNGQTLSYDLRESRGNPSWAGRRDFSYRTSSSSRNQALGNDILPASAASLAGRIEWVTERRGFSYPVLLLRCEDGTLLDFVLCPRDLLLAHDFELRPGETITVQYALTKRTRERLVLALTDSTGYSVTIRNGSGAPVWP